ncbi:hypothetical protein PsYK624_163230 [Phanerochaete sordida]|uniref:Uncharacterized protein n=1 Tax=Phanerochaete sordida TaxID=48140 RepID=A0A9P3LM49_9APHY|nr:hypothetical protein PsYK624_163230 [Phanerochaete sordida]
MVLEAISSAAREVALRTLDEEDLEIAGHGLLDVVREWPFVKLIGLAAYSDSFSVIAESVLADRRDALFRSLTSDIDKLKVIMRQNGVLLSGSRCLRHLDDEHDFTPGDWDWYVPDHGYDSFVAYLVEELGAKLVAETEDYRSVGDITVSESAQAHGISRIGRFTVGPTSHDVIRSRSGCAELPIVMFHSTTVMNYLSADRIDIAYPYTFFGGVGIKAARWRTSTDEFALLKYRERGYTMVVDPPVELRK